MSIIMENFEASPAFNAPAWRKKPVGGGALQTLAKGPKVIFI